jgi:hypothetical protein
MATPLHSQNFVAVNDGLLTNNRRIVTKTMWFNGTELTDKAQRALRNEQITMVLNNSGIVHCIYPDASMDPAEYERFKKEIGDYLSIDITFEILANFLRQHSRFQKCFQICRECHGKKRWIPAEKAYAYEHSGPYKVSDSTRDNLLEEIDCDEFYCEPLPDRICLIRLEQFFKDNPVQHYDAESMAELGKKLECTSEQKSEMLAELARFVHLEPRFPVTENKTFKPWKKIELTPGMSREEIIAYVESIRDENPVADLAFYAARDLSRCDWRPYLKASLERNPVSINGTKDLSDDSLIQVVTNLPDKSIYDGDRIAQPDEVWNFQTGDGVEKAILLAGIWKHRHPEREVRLSVQPGHARVASSDRNVQFTYSGNLSAELSL